MPAGVISLQRFYKQGIDTPLQMMAGTQHRVCSVLNKNIWLL